MSSMEEKKIEMAGGSFEKSCILQKGASLLETTVKIGILSPLLAEDSKGTRAIERFLDTVKPHVHSNAEEILSSIRKTPVSELYCLILQSIDFKNDFTFTFYKHIVDSPKLVRQYLSGIGYSENFAEEMLLLYQAGESIYEIFDQYFAGAMRLCTERDVDGNSLLDILSGHLEQYKIFGDPVCFSIFNSLQSGPRDISFLSSILHYEESQMHHYLSVLSENGFIHEESNGYGISAKTMQGLNRQMENMTQQSIS